MKTILGKKVNSYLFSKIKEGRKTKIMGYIWLSDGFSIKVEGNRFFICIKGKKTGFIDPSMHSYKKIKRMIGRWSKYYRRYGTFNNGTEYFKESIQNRLTNKKQLDHVTS